MYDRPLIRNVSETKLPSANHKLPRLVFREKKIAQSDNSLYNSRVLFMSEVKCAVKVNKCASSSSNAPTIICIRIYLFYKFKYIFGFIYMEVLNNIVFFETLTFNYGKTVLSEEHLKILSSSEIYFELRYVKNLNLL